MNISNLECIESVPMVPRNAGISLRRPHYKEIVHQKPELGFVELHIKNYFGNGLELYTLEQLKDQYPLSFHFAGLLLSLAHEASCEHLKYIKVLVDRFDPLFVSDFASWSTLNGTHLAGMMPLPYNNKTLNRLCDNISTAQDYLGRQILVENPLVHFELKGTMSEPEFLMRLVESTGCKLILDVNNIYVNSFNHKFDPKNYIDLISANIIGEIHISGYTKVNVFGDEMIFNICNNYICDQVWELYTYTLTEKGYIPTLIEWDHNLPSLTKLIQEANKCNNIIQSKYLKDAA